MKSKLAYDLFNIMDEKGYDVTIRSDENRIGIVVDSLELLLETVIKNSCLFNVYDSIIDDDFEGFKTEDVMDGVFIY